MNIDGEVWLHLIREEHMKEDKKIRRKYDRRADEP